MNPCANNFAPLSSPNMKASSSALTLDEEVHASASMTTGVFEAFSEQARVDGGIRPLNPNQPLTPHHTPFNAFSSLYTGMPMSNYPGPQPGWGAPVWYNPVAVAGPYCPTPPHPPQSHLLYGPAVPDLSCLNKAFRTINANARPRFESKRTRSRRRPSKDHSTNNQRENSSQKRIYNLQSFPNTSLRTRQGCVDENVFDSQKAKDTNNEWAIAVTPPRELSQYHNYSYQNADSGLLSNEQDYTCSRTPSPRWPDNGPPLFPDSLTIRTANVFEPRHSIHAPAEPAPSYKQYKERELLPHGACRNPPSVGSSKPRKTPSQETELLPRTGIQGFDAKPAQTVARPVKASEALESRNTGAPVQYSTPAESQYSHTTGHSVYSTDEELTRLGNREMRNSAPAISKNLHLKLQRPRNATADASIALQRSRSADGATIGATKKTSHKGAFNAIKGPVQPNVTSRVSEGSWSQSKRWMSQETKERMIFHKMMQNLHHLGADNSPFLPQNPLELTAFRAEMAELKKGRLSREVGWRMATLERRKAVANDPDEEPIELVPLMLDRKFEDKLSTVFASQNCFRDFISHDDAQWVTWPSLAQLKEEGDKRSSRCERYFPLPRLSSLAKSYAMEEEEDLYSADDTGHREMGVAKIDTRFIRSVSPAVDSMLIETPELVLRELPDYLQVAVLEMVEELDG